MIKEITSNRIPIKMWLDDVEHEALEQAIHLALLPFAENHVVLLPDAHSGFGMPIGGVIGVDPSVIIPFAIGSDIGCGMLAIKTNLTEMSATEIKQVMSLIRKRIPVGRDWHKTAQAPLPAFDATQMPVVKIESKNAEVQLGTLGGGNHFIEIQQDEEGTIWFMVHSGSRNLGKKVADHYHKLAKARNYDWNGEYVPPSWDLAFLKKGEGPFQAYQSQVQYCVDFALENRRVMAELIKRSFKEILPGIRFEAPINIAHNYAVVENHFGKEVMVHRKGATSARAGEIGIIPGSQGSASYIVEGLGNPESFHSCSHGAGRRLGRNQARKKLDLATEVKHLDDLGVIHSIRTEKDLDEAAGAYKDIDTVMENQKDLVKILYKLTPRAVIKG